MAGVTTRANSTSRSGCPLARQGLRDFGLSDAEIEHYLGVVEARVRSGQTGASWQLHRLAQVGGDVHRMMDDYLDNQRAGSPVHEWSLLMLTQYDALPPGLLDLPAARLGEVLSARADSIYSGRRTAVTVRLGAAARQRGHRLAAAQSVLKKYAAVELPRALVAFRRQRRGGPFGGAPLDGQPITTGYGRAARKHHPAELAMMQQVIDAMRARACSPASTSTTTPAQSTLRLRQPAWNRTFCISPRLFRASWFISSGRAACSPLPLPSCAGGHGGMRQAGHAGTSSMRPRSWKPACTCPNSLSTRWRRMTSTCFTRCHSQGARAGQVLVLTPAADIDLCPSWITSIFVNWRRRPAGPGCYRRLRPAAGTDENGEDYRDHLFDYRKDEITLRRPLMAGHADARRTGDPPGTACAT